MVVVDAMIHGFNWSPDNWAVPETKMVVAGAPGLNALLSRDDASRLTPQEIFRDWPAADLEEALFVEAGVDLVCYHGTPIWDFFKDGLSATSKGLELRERNPNRVLVYAAVNPLEGKKALDDMEHFVREHHVDGIKVYAATFYRGETYPIPLDDPEFGFPFIEKAIELGVKVIATHKAIPFGPANFVRYGMDDIPGVAARYPEMNFEVVHSGFAFLEETAFLAVHPNVWFNLEVSESFVVTQPRRFAEMMGVLLANGAADRIVHATGCPTVHARPTIDGLLEFEMPEDLVEKYGYPRLTMQTKRKILGENFLRMHGIEPDQLVARTANDKWSRMRTENPDAQPWSYLRERLAGRAMVNSH